MSSSSKGVLSRLFCLCDCFFLLIKKQHKLCRLHIQHKWSLDIFHHIGNLAPVEKYVMTPNWGITTASPGNTQCTNLNYYCLTLVSVSSIVTRNMLLHVLPLSVFVSSVSVDGMLVHKRSLLHLNINTHTNNNPHFALLKGWCGINLTLINIWMFPLTADRAQQFLWGTISTLHTKKMIFSGCLITVAINTLI